jgi:uncharacterized coiled-coil protein SlyX
MSENKCELSDKDLIVECRRWIRDLCSGKDFVLSIPPNFEKDPDMLLSEMVDRYQSLEQKLFEAENTIAEQKKLINTLRAALHNVKPFISKEYDGIRLSIYELLNEHKAVGG